VTSDELEAKVALTLEKIRSDLDARLRIGDKRRVGCKTVAIFGEDDGGGYAEIEQAFDEVVRILARLWGSPSKVGFGSRSIQADVTGIPDWFLDSGAMRYAFWSNNVVVATVAMLTHDADTLRSFEMRLAVPRP